MPWFRNEISTLYLDPSRAFGILYTALHRNRKFLFYCISYFSKWKTQVSLYFLVLSQWILSFPNSSDVANDPSYHFKMRTKELLVQFSWLCLLIIPSNLVWREMSEDKEETGVEALMWTQCECVGGWDFPISLRTNFMDIKDSGSTSTMPEDI